MDLVSEMSENSSLVSEDLRTLDGSVDGEPRADGLYEERFRVDRRKLESMLLGLILDFLFSARYVQSFSFTLFAFSLCGNRAL